MEEQNKNTKVEEEQGQVPGSDPFWEREHDEAEELYRLMRACGHILYHSGASKAGQGRILHILDYEGQISQKELQARLGIQSGSISEILTKLEREGLICREKDTQDRRKVIVKMTEDGKEHARKYHARRRDKDWFAALGPEQRAQLRELLQILLNSWEQLD